MGAEILNFFGGAPLNRLSWLRESTQFLLAATTSPATRWIVFRSGEPLVTKPETGRKSLAYLSTQQISNILGNELCFGQGEHVGSPLSLDNPLPKVLEAVRLRGPTIVFLGVQEKEGSKALPSAEFKSVQDLPGEPYFALDVSRASAEDITDLLEATKTEFCEPRSASSTFDSFDAPVFSLGRSMIDWNVRNRFCPACGSPVYSLWGGWKLSCTSLLPWANSEGREPCISAKGLHNFAHPRTDAVVITAILDDRGDRILLGRNKRFPPNFYSTLAGFVEPSETFEDSVKREIYEESGVRVHSVQYHSCQPWPYPANLMIGFYAWASPDQTIRIDLDTELEDARWFTRDEVLAVLNHPDGTKLSSRELKNLDIEHRTANVGTEGVPEIQPPAFRVPSASTAIAGVLISYWAYGKVQGLNPPTSEPGLKGKI